jgi:hypothetical protein
MRKKKRKVLRGWPKVFPEVEPTLRREFSCYERVGIVGLRLAFLDEWSEAWAHSRLESDFGRGLPLAEKVRLLLYDAGWDGSYKHVLSVREDHPVVAYLKRHGGLFWFAQWAFEKAKPLPSRGH